MASLRDSVNAILGNQPIISPDDERFVSGGSTSAARSNDASDNGSQRSNPADSASGSGVAPINPESASSPSSDSDSGSGRGNSSARSSRRGSSSSSGSGSATRNTSRNTTKESATFNLGDLVLILNNGIAYAVSESELIIDANEAGQMGDAISRLFKYSKTTKLSPLQLAWINLVATFVIIYGVRIWTILSKRWADKKNGTLDIPVKQQPVAQTVAR